MLIVKVISGYRQSDGQWNGMHELRELILAEVQDYSGMNVRVEYHGWDEPWDDIAYQIHLLRNKYQTEPISVVALAYSWGVGNGLVKLLKHLKRYGININAAVMADGAYHHWIGFTIAQWRVIFPYWRIDLNLPNLLEAHGFFQRVGWPVTSEPICGKKKNGDNVLGSWTELILPHTEMDNSPDFHKKGVMVVREQLRKVVPHNDAIPEMAPVPSIIIEKAVIPLKEPKKQKP